MTAQVASISDPLGYDTWLREDIDPSGRSASGIELVQNAIYHRITTDKLLLVGTDGDGFADFGENVQNWLNEPITQEIANARGPRLAVVIQRDPRIDQTSIQVAIDVQPRGALYKLLITISCRTVTGAPIDLIIGVNEVTVDILSQGT